MDPQNPDTVYAATAAFSGSPSDAWKSDDGGSSWRNVFSSPSAKLLAIAVNPQDSNIVYAATDNEVLRTTDGGENWTSMAGGPGRVHMLTFDPEDPNTIYAAGGAGLIEMTLVP